MKNYTIYLIRHGITQGNLEGRYIGLTDLPLCDEGFYAVTRYAQEHLYPDVQKVYYDRLEQELSARLSVFAWGWHNEAGIQVLRMILSGCFERHPKLQIISGHWGEFVPYYLARLDQALPQKCTRLSRSITQTYKEHIYVTPSGIFDYPSLRFVIDTVGADRILHSVDFPLVTNDGARAFLEDAPISDAQKQMIAWDNAAKLLKLQ